jgi:hypothetical protein
MKIELGPGDWVIIVVCMLLVPLSAVLGGKTSDAASSLMITVDDQLEGIYPLYRDDRIHIGNGNAGAVIEIKDGKVRFVSSSCHSKLCVLSGWHQHGGDQIACLPNRILVSLQSVDDRYDAINF